MNKSTFIFFCFVGTTRLISDFVFPLEIETRGWIPLNFSKHSPFHIFRLWRYFQFSCIWYKKKKKKIMIILLFIASSFIMHLNIECDYTLSASDIIQLFLVFLFFSFHFIISSTQQSNQWMDNIRPHSSFMMHTIIGDIEHSAYFNLYRLMLF